ncbi:hypothetical protein [Burkholderia diffusa]|uniref:hypothetical protein n=1 Tax=Burkholderia diffusa TaxID=488732 RepID=UPI002AB20EF1|nr:hypothetical protein [Burkholderia diffusa]
MNSTTDPALKAQYLREAKDWAEGGDNRVALHIVAGALTAGGLGSAGDAAGAGHAPSDGSVVVKQVQYSPSSADSVHGGQYYKFTYTDGSTVKVIDPSTYKVKGWPESNTTFYDQAGKPITRDPVGKKWSRQ